MYKTVEVSSAAESKVLRFDSAVKFKVMAHKFLSFEIEGFHQKHDISAILFDMVIPNNITEIQLKLKPRDRNHAVAYIKKLLPY